jgi:glutamate synthase domain-containing protein 1
MPRSTTPAEEIVTELVMRVNTSIDGALVFSSGRNLGVFKAAGWPEEVADFYRIEEYEGHCWLAHNRYPTNTPGWWGGAHPLQPPRLVRGSQRRDHELRHEPAVHRVVRL